jgi:thiamine-phosphate pyrophosphorylase
MRAVMASQGKPEARPAPRLYLMTPLLADADAFAGELAAALDAADIAAVLVRLADADERTLINRAKAICAVAQPKGAAALIDGRAGLVARSGADGAHLTGIDQFTEALGTSKPERIAGVGGLQSRHNAMVAAEAGADYVMFGEPDEHGMRPSFAAIEERVAWWAEVFESPCVTYAASLEEIAPLVSAGADFIVLGDWLWRDRTRIAATLAAAREQMKLPESAA